MKPTAMVAQMYNSNSQLQAQAQAPSLESLAAAAARLPLSHGQPIKVADLGASHGANSMQPVKAILAALSQRPELTAAGAPPQEVAVYHEDLPSNDFSELIALVNDPTTSYLPQQQQQQQQQQPPNLSVFSYVVGRSFYEPLFPRASMHLTFCFTALHFLSARPLENRVSLWSFNNPDPAFQAAYVKQAADDLTSFLRLRAAETVPGGALVVHFTLTADEATRATGWTLHLIEEVAQEMLRHGSLSPDELAAMNSYAFYQKQQEVMDVLASVKDLWEVKAAFARTTHTPLKARYEAGEITAEQLAAESSRAREAVLKGHMVSELARTRGQEEAERVVEGMWARYREKLAAAPQEEIPGSRFMYVYLERTAAPMP